MKPAALIAAGVLIGAAYWYSRQDAPAAVSDIADSEPDLQTAGDEISSFIDDGLESMKSYVTDWPSGSEPYQAMIISAAFDSGVPVKILAWLLWKESRYNPVIIDGTRRSSAGALGIAQFMPATAVDELGSVAAALDPSQAIPGAARYLAKCYRWTGSASWAAALAAYNWGAGNVNRQGLANAPAETRDYYTTILAKANYSDTGSYA